MGQHILLAVDESDQSWDALEHALAQYPDDRLTVLTVVDPLEGLYVGDGGEYYSQETTKRLHEEAMKNGERRCERAREQAKAAGFSPSAFETTVETGRPARTIVDYAEENDVDHIVMSSHGRSGITRILLGSVAEAVTRRAPVPVTIVR